MLRRCNTYAKVSGVSGSLRRRISLFSMRSSNGSQRQRLLPLAELGNYRRHTPTRMLRRNRGLPWCFMKKTLDQLKISPGERIGSPSTIPLGFPSTFENRQPKRKPRVNNC